MAPTACPCAFWRICFSISFTLLCILIVAATADAQTATYHLHKEASTTANLFQLKTANPDSTSLAIQSGNLKNLAAGEYLIKEFDTQSGVPNVSGTIPSGSTITFTLWLRKTSNSGTMFPRAKLRLNSSTGTLLGTSTGATALTNTVTLYTFTTTTSSNISINTNDRFYLWVGVNLTTAPTTNTNAELDVEGTPGGNFDSLIIVPLPPLAPSISSLSPNVGPAGTSVTINGSNFGATQGTSTVTFNGVAATASNWSNTAITATVPAGATTGPVVVTVGGVASNGVTFTVADVGSISGTVSRASDGAPINGALVEALQSGIVKGSATSAANGSYSVTGLLSGTYDVRASATRYITQVQTGVVVSAPASTSVNFSLVDAGPITNVYDEAGRLVAVIDPIGETVTYTYDAVGNLLTISRYVSTQVSIVEFTPNKGPIGTQVTIYGTGFSQTPAQNTVQFNGTNATVVSSSATQIVTNVPSGATTGPISVTTPSGSATTSTPFTVGSDAPVITSFTPIIGTAGTTVNISGSNFDSTLTGNRVAFNGTRSIVTAATPTAITTSVPAGATSGKISDTTPVGTGVSTGYFFIPPSPFTVADVQVTDQMTPGSSKTITISTANKIAMVVFEGTVGQRISLNLTGVTISGGSVFIYKPDGSTLGSASFNTSGGFIDTKTLPVAGTYTILIDPSSTNTGNATINLYAITDVTGTITMGGPAVPVTTTMPGQNAQLTFAGTAGQRVSVNGSSAFGSCWTVGIYKPDGLLLADVFTCGSTGFIEPQTLPVSGNYVILIDPNGSAVGQATINLYEVIDVTGSITANGPSVPVTLPTPGQRAILSFDGTVGQRISANGSSSFNGCWNIGIYKPDGSQLANVFTCGSTGFIEPQTLPDSGTYTLVIDPNTSATGTATVNLYEVTDVTGSITVNGPSVPVSLPTPGQKAILSFDGIAGQRISANGSSSFNGCWNFGIYKPDGTQLTNTFSCGSNIFLEPQALPVSGTYTLVIDPNTSATGTATVNVYEVVDVSGTITVNGAAVPVTLATPGQKAILSFDGTAGQRISANGSSSFNGCWNFGIYKPDGTQLTNTFSCGSSIFLEPQALPVSGTYTLVIDPNTSATGTATVNVYEVVDVTGSITISGPSVPVTLPTPGQKAILSFDGTAGQRVSANGSSSFNGCWNFGIYKPDGTQLTNTFSCGSSIFLEPQTLPVSGTYTLVIDPNTSATGTATANLYDVVDVSGSITLGGAAVNVNITVPGQNASYTMSGTAGQQATVRVASSTMSCVRVTLLKPDGTQLTTTFSCGSNFNLATQTLPVTGTYTITVDPSGANLGSMSLSVTNP